MSSTACDDNQTGADMTRNELLTKLAIKLHPNDFDRGEPYHWHEFQFTGDEYFQRRAELINKPSWGEAPVWAQWLAQDEDGEWFWFELEPDDATACWKNFSCEMAASNQGRCPAGHNWRDTLEKRPMDLYDMQDTLGNAWARDRRAVIDEMAREVCPTQWREGGHMRYKGHTITWGEYVARRHEIEDEDEDDEEFTVETWREREFNPTTSSLTDYQARGAAIDTGLCSDGKPCGTPPEPDGDAHCVNCPNYAEDSDDEGPLAQVMREQMQWAAEKWQRGEMEATGNQARYQDSNGDDWIDEFARTATPEEFRGAMRFSLGKYNRRAGKKDELTSEIRKMRDYCDRWLAYEEGDA